MTREEFQRLPERVTTAEARAVLGTSGRPLDRGSLRKLVAAHPRLRHTLPGMARGRLVRDEVLKLLSVA